MTFAADTNSLLDRPVLILGASGMAGRALVAAGRKRGYSVFGASRSGADIDLDVEDPARLEAVIDDLKPSLIINTVADVLVGRCEEDPGRSWRINARPVSFLAELSRKHGCRLVHISTDHFFSGDKDKRHREDAEVILLNEYARTKFAAESLALTWKNSVVVRTNIVGLRSGGHQSFAEWCLDVILNDREATLFDDQFVSCIDIWNFAEIVFDLSETTFAGVVNVASCDVFSKAEFAFALANAAEKTLTKAKVGSVSIQSTSRPDSLGLDVELVESLLQRKMPSLLEVVTAIYVHAKTSTH